MRELLQIARDKYDISRDNLIVFMNEHFYTEIRRNLASAEAAERRMDIRAYNAMNEEFDKISKKYGGALK